MSEEEKGLRFNKGKIELTQCPTSLVAAVAYNLMKNSEKHGGKYPDNNWRKGMSWTTVINCLERHLQDFKNGVDVDPEDGVPTIWKVATNAAFLIEYANTCPEMDDRYKGKQFTLHEFPKFEQEIKKVVEQEYNKPKLQQGLSSCYPTFPQIETTGSCTNCKCKKDK